MLKHIWACECRHEAECRQEDQALGAVYQCQGCKKVWGCVRPKRGGKAWVEIAESDVQFHGLIEEPETEEEMELAGQAVLNRLIQEGHVLKVITEPEEDNGDQQ